jgi:flagellar biogenesis protein FliO
MRFFAVLFLILMLALFAAFLWLINKAGITSR